MFFTTPTLILTSPESRGLAASAPHSILAAFKAQSFHALRHNFRRLLPAPAPYMTYLYSATCMSRRTQAAVIMAISSMGRGWHHLCFIFRCLNIWVTVCPARQVGDMLGFVAGYAVPGEGNGCNMRALPEGHRKTLRPIASGSPDCSPVAAPQD